MVLLHSLRMVNKATVRCVAWCVEWIFAHFGLASCCTLVGVICRNMIKETLKRLLLLKVCLLLTWIWRLKNWLIATLLHLFDCSMTWVDCHGWLMFDVRVLVYSWILPMCTIQSLVWWDIRLTEMQIVQFFIFYKICLMSIWSTYKTVLTECTFGLSRLNLSWVFKYLIFILLAKLALLLVVTNIFSKKWPWTD